MKSLFLTLTILFSLTSQATTPLKYEMKDIAETLREVFVPALQKDEFNSAKNEKLISGKLAHLERVFSENMYHFNALKNERHINARIMKNLISQTKATFDSGNKDLARQMVKAVPGLCLSCHGQDQLKAKVFRGEIPAKLGHLEQAEFDMATRRPDEAQTHLQMFLSQKFKSDESSQIITALRSELQISIHLQKNWFEIKDMLQKHSVTFKEMPEVLKTIQGWIKGVEKCKGAFSEPLVDVNQVPKILKKALGTSEPALGLLADPPEEVVFLKLGQELHRYLREKATSEKMAQTYYWLSVCERAEGYSFFYSLADGYLKACIEEWSTQPYAKKCLEEYKSFIEFAYTGSSGTNIPTEVKKQIEYYEKKLGAKQ